MWDLRTRNARRDLQSEPRPGDASHEDGAPGAMPLARYRSYGRFFERYWSRLFSMTEADMTRLADLVRTSGGPLDLTTLAQDVVRARLRQGPQLVSGPAPDGSMPSQVVRLWDPGLQWRVGDRAILVMPDPGPGRSYVPRVGEIRQVGDDHVIIQVDGIASPQVVALGMNGGPYRTDARLDRAAEAEMAALAKKRDEVSQINHILWRFGGHIVGRLLHALQADPQFVELEGLWFLTALANQPGEAVLVALTRAMFERTDAPMTVDDLLSMMHGGGQQSFASRCGLAMAMQNRPDLFTNVGTLPHPRWVLAGPPPMRLVARCAVFDPETYIVLCTPGETLSPVTARRLWDTGLLSTALEPESVPESEGTPGSDVLRSNVVQGVRRVPELDDIPEIVRRDADTLTTPRNGAAAAAVALLSAGPTPPLSRSRRRKRWLRWLPFGSRD